MSGFGVDKKLKTRIIPNDVIELEKNKTLTLISIIVHIGESISHGHFVAYVKGRSQNTWYKYDDMYPGVVEVKSIDKKRIQENLVSVIYSKYRNDDVKIKN